MAGYPRSRERYSGYGSISMPSFVSEAATRLQAVFEAKNVRIWRYVDSQMVLFGCPTGREGESEPSAFEEQVAFLRDPRKLAEYASAIVVRVSDFDATSEVPRHPLWHVPDYEKLSKSIRENYIESILVNDPHLEEQSLHDLVGVVCIDAPYANWEALEPTGPDDRNKKSVEDILTQLRDVLRDYANSLFRKGFDSAASFLRSSPGTRDQERYASGSFRPDLDRLLNAIDPGSATVSLYLRAYNNVAEVPIALGKGDYYERLLLVESRLRDSSSAHFPKSLFSAKAGDELGRMPRVASDLGDPGGSARDGAHTASPLDAVLFPGSGGAWETFEKYREWFAESREALRQIPQDVEGGLSAMKEDAEWVYSHAAEIESRGSFGVFPIRCMAETMLKGQLVGLLCVAVEDQRNFFTWSRRLVIERFCDMVGRVHDARVAPVLTRVDRQTHSDLIASPPTLDKLREDAGPLSPHRPSPVDRTCMAFVVSVDLRKSTDLMLKVLPHRTQDYAQALMKIFGDMRDALEAEFGVFDKFTGDGVLAFFPDFFSGTYEDAGYRLLRAAERCHQIFAASYDAFWEYLVTVPAPGSREHDIPGAVGLGIGVDYGRVRLVNVGDELTVVGAPVVYAWRLSGSAPACTTFLNQRAFDVLQAQRYLEWHRETLGLKHEGGPTIAYRARIAREHSELKPWSLIAAGAAKPWPDAYVVRSSP